MSELVADTVTLAFIDNCCPNNRLTLLRNSWRHSRLSGSTGISTTARIFSQTAYIWVEPCVAGSGVSAVEVIAPCRRALHTSKPRHGHIHPRPCPVFAVLGARLPQGLHRAAASTCQSGANCLRYLAAAALVRSLSHAAVDRVVRAIRPPCGGTSLVCIGTTLADTATGSVPLRAPGARATSPSGVERLCAGCIY